MVSREIMSGFVFASRAAAVGPCTGRPFENLRYSPLRLRPARLIAETIENECRFCMCHSECNLRGRNCIVHGQAQSGFS
ncbi:hypothetical protein BD413DRAFT_597133 [Trametes elegans]|nr:hypothetical protein BD413DRAFT_597133 [Trametes elegans]